MIISSKNGTEIEITITGSQEEPVIAAKRFEIGGNKVPSCNPMIMDHAPGNRNTEAGLLFPRIMEQNVYVQCASSMPAIMAAIAELPHKKYWAQKVDDVIDADGVMIRVQVWDFDKILSTESNTIISETEMGYFLDSKHITKIEIADAVKLWADENEAARMKVNESGNARARAMFEDDEADAGYEQACENAGIPKSLR